MTELARKAIHGPVHTLRTEFAGWDRSLEQWQAAQHFTLERFHPNGRTAERESHNLDGSISRCSFAYDSLGRIQEMRFGTKDDSGGKTVHFYDELGRLTRVVSVDRSGTELDLEAHTYGEGGKKTKVYFVPKRDPNMGFTYSMEGSDLSYGADDAATIVTRYEDRGQPDEVLFYDEDQRVLKRSVCTRDATGQLMKEEVLGEPVDRAMPSTTYEYDGKGRMVERHTRIGELGDDRTTFRYDDHDNPVEETAEFISLEMEVDEEGKTHTTKESSHTRTVQREYKYDALGNWIELVVWCRLEPDPNFERSSIWRREIAYY